MMPFMRWRTLWKEQVRGSNQDLSLRRVKYEMPVKPEEEISRWQLKLGRSLSRCHVTAWAIKGALGAMGLDEVTGGRHVDGEWPGSQNQALGGGGGTRCLESEPRTREGEWEGGACVVEREPGEDDDRKHKKSFKKCWPNGQLSQRLMKSFTS